MRWLDDILLRDRYDVIVVGAGLGGLTAASLLAKRGVSVLLIDRQNKPGGSCTSFKREDVVYDVGTAMLYGFGERGFKPFRFLMNELEEPIDVVAHATLARMTFEGHEITFWPDLDRFLGELGDFYPEEREGLRAFYADLFKMYENIVLKNEVVVPPSEFSSRQGLRQLLSGPLAMLKMQKLLNMSVKDLLDRYFHTPGVVNFFDKLCSAYCYCTAAETPAILAATMFLDNHVGGVYYPAGGAQMLPNKLEKAFERDGGQILYRHLVDEILIREGQAYGVRLAGGQEILADRVVANATVWNIYGNLVRPEHIAPERLAWAQGLVPTFPSMTLYLLVDAQALPPSVLPWEIFIEKGEVIDSSDLTLYVNALVDRTLCPEGKLVITVIAPNLGQWPSPTDPAYGSAEYGALKEREAQLMLDQIEQHYPGFGQHIEGMTVGTPTTIERYLLKNGGAVGGPKNAIGQHMLNRLHARSEWKNLYFCGDSTVMATGAPATAVSGVGAANVILRDLRKPDYDARKHPRQYVRYVDQPYRRPPYRAGDPLTAENVPSAAAQCQWCESPACVASCPAGMDIPGALRRLEAGNALGAARLLRQRNPLAELSCAACGDNPPCQRSCHRRTFAGEAVPIADLLRWACQAAGEAGWPRGEAGENGWRVAVVGSGPAGLSCAYYLALLGVRVDLLDSSAQPADRLRRAAEGMLALPALERELPGVLRAGVRWVGGGVADLPQLRGAYEAVYVTLSAAELPWDAGLAPAQDGSTGQPGLYVGGESIAAGQGVAEGAAEGRRVAAAIAQQLRVQPSSSA